MGLEPAQTELPQCQRHQRQHEDRSDAELPTPGVWHEIHLEFDGDLRLSIDGEPQVLQPGTAGWAAAWNPDHGLSLGNTL